MDKMIEAASSIVSRDYRVYMYDGNQKIYNAKSIKHLMDFLLVMQEENQLDIDSIYKIEEVDVK